MKDSVAKGVFAAVIGGLSAYFRIMAIPIMILIVVMVADYISGMAKAWIIDKIDSKIGLIGIVKKLSYMLVVVVAACVDWLIGSGLIAVGVEFERSYYFGVIVTIWLIINELISILENLNAIGVPLPSFLGKVVSHLKAAVDNKDKEDKNGNS